jgi:hypothetical protein
MLKGGDSEKYEVYLLNFYSLEIKKTDSSLVFSIALPLVCSLAGCGRGQGEG